MDQYHGRHLRQVGLSANTANTGYSIRRTPDIHNRGKDKHARRDLREKEIGMSKAKAARASYRAMMVAAISSMPALASPVLAQASGAAADSVQVEDIVVTARRRTESLQSVPISADVVSGTAIQTKGIQNLLDLSSNTPAVAVTSGAPQDRIYVRGTGSGDNAGLEQSVGIFIDDIYHGRSKNSKSSFLDLERVEILKGPQTTYFGNNAIAGALNVVTHTPGEEAEGFARALYNVSFNNFTAEGAYTIPFSPEFRIRIAGLTQQGDGWLHDAGIHRDIPGNNLWVGRISAIWQPSDRFSALFKVEVADEKQTGSIPEVLTDCPPPPAYGGPSGLCAADLASGITFDNNLRRRSTEPGGGYRQKRQEYVGKLTWQAGSQTITSTTGYYRYNYFEVVDADGSPFQFLTGYLPERFYQFSQELRIASDDTRPLSYIAGIYFQKNHLNQQNHYHLGILTPVIQTIPPFAALTPYLPLGYVVGFQQDEKTYSGFGALTYKFTPQFRVNAALRYSSVHKDFLQNNFIGDGRDFNRAVVPLPADLVPLGAALGGAFNLTYTGQTALSRKDDEWMPSIDAQYFFTPEVMIYGRYTHGFKAGGFNGTATTGIASQYDFDPEKVDAFEAGLRSKFLDDRLLLNITAFHSSYSNLQTSQYFTQGAGIINIITNAASSVSDGIELEARVAASRDWHFGATATLLDSHYKSFPNAQATVLQQLSGIVSRDLSGQKTDYAPKISASFDAEYNHAITDSLHFWGNLNLFYSDRYFLYTHQGVQNPYARINARISIGDPDRRWELSLIGKNLNNAKVKTFLVGVPLSPGSNFIALDEPRSVSLQARVNF